MKRAAAEMWFDEGGLDSSTLPPRCDTVPLSKDEILALLAIAQGHDNRPTLPAPPPDELDHEGDEVVIPLVSCKG